MTSEESSRLHRGAARKGRVYEREVVAMLREAGWTDAKRLVGAARNHIDKRNATPDIYCPRAGITVSCKYGRVVPLRIYSLLAAAEPYHCTSGVIGMVRKPGDIYDMWRSTFVSEEIFGVLADTPTYLTRSLQGCDMLVARRPGWPSFVFVPWR